MTRYFIGTDAQCKVVQLLQNKLHGYPSEGVDIGRGRHTEHVYGGAGWTMRQSAIERERYEDGHIVVAGKTFIGLSDPDAAGDSSHLTLEELDGLRDKWAAGETKPKPKKAIAAIER